MNSMSRNARISGILYLAIILLGPIRLLFIPNALIVSGNGAETVHNIATHEALFRFGIYADILIGAIEGVLVFSLYRLLGAVNRTWAVLMLVWGLADVPPYILNTLNDFGALTSATGASFLTAFDQPQREAITMLFLKIHQYGIIVNEVFWGLWLIPFGLLVYKSGILPRLLGVWLIVNGFAYVSQNITGVVFPQFLDLAETVSVPLQFGEIAIMLWLIIMGAKERPLPAATVET